MEHFLCSGIMNAKGLGPSLKSPYHFSTAVLTLSRSVQYQNDQVKFVTPQNKSGFSGPLHPNPMISHLGGAIEPRQLDVSYTGLSHCSYGAVQKSIRLNIQMRLKTVIYTFHPAASEPCSHSHVCTTSTKTFSTPQYHH